MRSTRQILAVPLLAAALSFLAPQALAGFEEGMAAYRHGDYATALKEWRPLAEQGDAVAQYNLGAMYVKGEGVPQDDKEAAGWFRKAAEQGYADAQFRLAVMYAQGQGVPQDYKKAVAWLRKATEQGHARAQNNLGVMYEYGMGVPEDKTLAYALYNLSAASDPSGITNARDNRDRVAGALARAKLLEAQALSRELNKPGNFAKALDAYLDKYRGPGSRR